MDVGNVDAVFPDLTQRAGDYHGWAIEDVVTVPAGLPAGAYVVGFRWDCEQTSQIWSSCADITIE